MEEIFSIGETAKINNVSIKALRHYDEIGLLKPKYINKENGYRYYTYDQFSFIDKIKRYKNIGMPLKEMKELFESHNLKLIEDFLKQQIDNLEEERLELERKQQDVQWLCDFFEYSKSLETTEEIYTKHFPERYMIATPCSETDSIYEMDMELRRIVTSEPFNNIQILNPYGYILDFESLLNNKFKPLFSTVSIRDLPEEKSKYIKTIPEGDYICCRAKILFENFNVSFLKDYCSKNNIKKGFVVACEYLKSLNDPVHSPYEIQILEK